MKQVIAVITLSVALALSAQANVIGDLTFTGEITTLGNPFGSDRFALLGRQTVTEESGLFDGIVRVGDALGGTPGTLTIQSNQTWTLDGAQFSTPLGIGLAGGSAGFLVTANLSVTGLALPSNYKGSWLYFYAPPWEEGTAHTGQIAMHLSLFNNIVPSTPDTGSTALLFGTSLLGLFATLRRCA